MLIVVVLEVLAIAAAYSMSAGVDSAVLLGGVILGASLAIPDQSAFNHFGQLGVGTWLMADEPEPVPAVTPPPAEPAV
jgi:hypothetical protein